jgi:ATP-dependent RNA helicase DDX35
VAARVADEVGSPLGQAVGYSVRFASKFCETTAVKFMTDGSLVREIMQDPLLRKYTVLMLDDVHERSLNTDLLLGLLKKIRKKRPDLKLIISSATLEAQKLARYFEDKDCELTSKIMVVSGRVHPVKSFFLPKPIKNYVLKAAELARDIHSEKPAGNFFNKKATFWSS